MKKKMKLKDNIKYLENLSLNLEKSIKELIQLYEQMNAKKDKLKMYVQKIFTKIRKELNEREEELFKEIDKVYEKSFIKEEIMKKCENLPKKVKISLEKSKSTDDKWKDENLIKFLIDECLNIENNISDINNIYHNIKKVNKNETKIIFLPKEERLTKFYENIRNFGNIVDECIINSNKIR